LGLFRHRLGWILLAAVLALALTHVYWLGALGSVLVVEDQPFRADIAVVLAGDGYGNRLLKAADLVREGYTSRVLVSGPPGYYGYHESDLAVPFAVSKGYPEAWFVKLPHEAHSTREEAAVILAELRRRHVTKFLVVTSDYHSRRTRNIFRSQASGLEFRVVAAPDRFFQAHSWWRSRQGAKVFAMEWMKTLANWVGI